MLRLAALLLLALVARAALAPEALFVVVGDQHSAYDRAAHFVGRVDALRAVNPGVPLAILIDGDAFEYGNAVARRTHGAIDFALIAALAKRAPTIVNLGNHEPEFYDIEETIRRLTAAGATVLAGNVARPDGTPYAPSDTRLSLGQHAIGIAGVTTDQLATYRVAVRPQLALRDPVTAARRIFDGPLKDVPLRILLSHAGLNADRAILAFTPDGTLFAGAHDHLRFVHRAGRTVYFHSGSWMEFMSVARLMREANGLRWDVEQLPIAADGPVDPELAAFVRDTLAKNLTAGETASVGRLPRALGPTAAATFAVAAARFAAHADVAVIGATTFGAGLPAGEVTRFAFDACVRFDGTLFTGEISGVELKKLLARANQGPDTPFAARAGENLVAVAPDAIEDARTYRFVTTDWIAKNAKTYLGENPPALVEQPELKLKAAVMKMLEAVSEGERKAR